MPIIPVSSDDSVAQGASIIGALITGIGTPKIKELLFLDATPYPLGILFAGSEPIVIIEKNSQIPTKQTKVFSTNKDY